MPQRCLEQGFARAVICRKATFTLSVSAITLPDANPYPFEHKIGVFVLGKGSGERSVIIVWSIMVCEEVFVFVFDLIWRVRELVLRGIVECCIFDFWRLGGDWLEMMGCGCWLWIGL